MDWQNYLPNGLPQFLAQETNACTDYSCIDSIESQELALTGNAPQYSRRWLAYISRTSPVQGNSEQVVFPAVAQYGLVLESSWPQTDNMTADEFYAAPTTEQYNALIAEGQAWLNKWAVSYDFFMPFSNISKAPLIARLNVGSTFHFVEVLNKDWYYDSERHNDVYGLTPATTYPVVVEYHQIIINPKNMSNTIFVHKAGSQEYGFYVPATSIESIKDKALNYGLAGIIKPDGTVDFGQAKEVTGI